MHYTARQMVRQITVELMEMENEQTMAPQEKKKKIQYTGTCRTNLEVTWNRNKKKSYFLTHADLPHNIKINVIRLFLIQPFPGWI